MSESPELPPALAEKPAGLPPGKYSLVGWDMDTTGRGLNDEICQIAAYTPKQTYSQYIMPYGDLNPGARQHNVKRKKKRNKKRLPDVQVENSNIPNTKSEISALSDFLDWLEKEKGDGSVILIYHEPRRLSPTMLLVALTKYKLLDRFKSIVVGFADSYALAADKFKSTMKYGSLRELVRFLLDADSLAVDSALGRATAAYRILERLAQGEQQEVDGGGEGVSLGMVETARVWARPVSTELEALERLHNNTRSEDDDNILRSITFFEKTDKNYKIQYESGERAQLTILNNHVFRYYMSPTGVFQDYPTPNNSTDVAKINAKKVTDYGADAFDKSYVKDSEHRFIVYTDEIKITFDKIKGTFYVHDKRLDKDVLNEHEPISYNDVKTTQKILQHRAEYFFGGGMQNGRFTHKGEIIHIVNSNDWVDGGVTSPSPFYWSSYGYGVLRNTWQPGIYNFGSESPGIIELMHKETQFDAFYFINPRPRQILEDYYELTGQPILMPEYAFYEAHLNSFNRDYWVEVDRSVQRAIKFEDGIFYKSYLPDQMEDKTGFLESLNGENNNYQFSARAMIDRYKTNDMPLGWFIPNDGYCSGYGKTDSLKGDIENLKEFVEYANKNGVEVALWMESNFEPKDPDNPKKGERDLSKEVGTGAVALKCDVAWISDGYSYALNAVERVTSIFEDRANKQVRPLIIMVDGWAGTQRYSGIWSGDQTGGKWEYIRFHIPTYIGAGLSGIPVVGSDMDGIYGGGDREVNVRDFQWKTFTPLQLNMDGWANIPKTPFSYDHEAIAIKRAYLKFKAMLLPYNYTIANESIHGLPMIRAMFLEFPNDTVTYTKDCQYQFMWGPSFLVAPVYQKTILVDDNEVKREVRSGIYLPDPKQVWIDLFTGQKYQGGKVYNTLEMPLWKIPVFVKDGAIIPFVNNNNNPNEIKRNCRIITFYPSGRQNFKIYEDDGKSAEYLTGHHATTEVTSVRTRPAENCDLHIHIHKTKGHYKKLIKERTTLLQIMTALRIDHVKATINDKPIEIQKAVSEEEFQIIKSNAYFFNEEFLINPYLRKCESEKELFQKCLLIKIENTDITKTEITVKIGLYMNEDVKRKIIGNIEELISNRKHPDNFHEKETSPTSVTVQWDEDKEAIYYDIERDGVIFTTIKEEAFVFEGFKYETEHTLRIRSVFNDEVSKWSPYLTVQTKPGPFKDTVKVS